MNTVNTVLMMVLCAIIGFSIGNAWGRYAMKQAFMSLVEEILNGLKMKKEE